MDSDKAKEIQSMPKQATNVKNSELETGILTTPKCGVRSHTLLHATDIQTPIVMSELEDTDKTLVVGDSEDNIVRLPVKPAEPDLALNTCDALPLHH